MSNRSEQVAAGPVFIAGVARSGTTLLFRTLLRHSSFRPQRKPVVSRIVESKVFQNCSEDNPHLFHFMQDDRETYGAFLEATHFLRSWQRLMKKLNLPRRLRGNSPRVRGAYWRLTGGARLVRTFFAYARDARQVRRMAEKTPVDVAYIPEIKATFPSAAMIWIHRHPVDVYSSYRRRGRTETERKITTVSSNRWLNVDPETFCRRHTKKIGYLREALDQGRLPVKLFSYEEFVSDPHAAFRDLCDFLGEPYEPSCVEGEAEEVKDVRDPLLSNPIQHTTKNWRDFLTPEECRFIENSLRDDMAFLGYGPKEDLPQPPGPTGRLAGAPGACGPVPKPTAID
jgi:hypothetical protein